MTFMFTPEELARKNELESRSRTREELEELEYIVQEAQFRTVPGEFEPGELALLDLPGM